MVVIVFVAVRAACQLLLVVLVVVGGGPYWRGNPHEGGELAGKGDSTDELVLVAFEMNNGEKQDGCMGDWMVVKERRSQWWCLLLLML